MYHYCITSQLTAYLAYIVFISCFLISSAHLHPDYPTRIPFQKIDNAPHGKARAQRDNKGLQGADCTCKKLHKVYLHI